MSLTRIDCSVFRPKDLSVQASSFVVVNPCSRPGSLVATFASATSGSLGSQVACRLALDHFVAGVLDCFDDPGRDAERATKDGAELSVSILEAAFKRANTSVYEFGHRLAAGGRLATSLIGLVMEKEGVAAGRVGQGAVYLLRDGTLLPFFEGEAAIEVETERVGTNSLVSVELASIPLEPGDTLLAVSERLSASQEVEVRRLYGGDDVTPEAQELAERLYKDAPPLFLLCASGGPDAIYLSAPVVNDDTMAIS